MAVKADTELLKLNLTFDRGLDVEGRRIYIFDVIDAVMASNVVMGLEYLSLTDGKITIMVNSPGGTMADMFAIYDAMRACPTQIHTIGLGEVCSAAGLLLVGGDRSFASRNCLFMAHQVKGGVDNEGDLDLNEAQIAATRMSWDRWAGCMAEHTSHTKNWWKKEMPSKHHELWLTAEDMMLKKHGIIEGIWE